MKTQLVLFVLVVLCSNILSTVQQERIGSYKAVTHYQYAITWAPIYCKYIKGCVPNLPQRFFMHGIWAGNSSGMTEDNCYDKNGQPKPPIPYSLVINLSDLHILYYINLLIKEFHACSCSDMKQD